MLVSFVMKALKFTTEQSWQFKMCTYVNLEASTMLSKVSRQCRIYLRSYENMSPRG